MARNAKNATALEASGSDEAAVEAASGAGAAKVAGEQEAPASEAQLPTAEASDGDAAVTALVAAVAELGEAEGKVAPEWLTEVVAIVAVVSAPNGPRRRAGHAFGPVPVRLRVGDLSSDELAAITADPLLKVTFEGMNEDEAARAAE